MEGFTIVDGGVALIIVVSAILAYSRGLIREGMAIVGWIAAAILAFTFAGAAEPLVREIPYVGDILGESCELAVIAAFALVFALALVVASIFTPLLSSAVRHSALGPIDQGLGFLFGVLRGVLLVAVGFVVYDRVIVNEGIPSVEESRSATVFSRAQAALEAQIPEDAPSWIVQRYEALVGECGTPVETAPVVGN
ncbi:CvpA family protein [Jannaschia seohaensis]|uniref:Membrane protein required for colicin V production n=1 Tax=Jannaschia seohaensis TaxID=475081 RepID=A0A2Y9AMZ6_9RHOB|nr:CvpA family protein [Jannaschia seohaensis]PWJ19179.1 membrane protein required for colicin V production [Jannaschia seohaensis]SSA45841.1 membrane protein required for colicin V production [Jannaschia seohaensis]